MSKQTGKSQRPSNDRKKLRMAKSRAGAAVRHSQNAEAQEARERVNKAGGPTPWEQAKAARVKRRAIDRAANPRWEPVVTDEFGFIARTVNGRVKWTDERREKTRHRHMGADCRSHVHVVV